MEKCWVNTCEGQQPVCSYFTFNKDLVNIKLIKMQAIFIWRFYKPQRELILQKLSRLEKASQMIKWDSPQENERNFKYIWRENNVTRIFPVRD